MHMIHRQQQRTWLLHCIALDMKVGYLLVSFLHPTFVTKKWLLDCCTESKVCFLCCFAGCQSTQGLTANSAHSRWTLALALSWSYELTCDYVLPAQWLSELYCPVTCQHFTVTSWYWQVHCWTAQLLYYSTMDVL